MQNTRQGIAHFPSHELRFGNGSFSAERWPRAPALIYEAVNDPIVRGIDYHPDGMITFITDTILKKPPAGSPPTEAFEVQQSHFCAIAQHIHAHTACLLQYILETHGRWIAPNYIHPPDFIFRDPNGLGGNVGALFRLHVPSLVIVDIPGLVETHRRYTSLVAQGDGIAFASLLLGSLASLSNSDPTRAVLDAWAGIEALVRDEFIRQYGRHPTGAERAYDQVEALHQDGVFDLAQYRRLTTARNARNDWMHQLTPSSLQRARDAIEVGAELFARRFGIRIPSGTTVR